VVWYGRETLSFNPVVLPFYIGDGWIASSMAVYYSTIFADRRCNTLIPDALPDETAELR